MIYRLRSRIASAEPPYECPYTHHVYDNPYNAIKDACDVAESAPHLSVWVENEFGEILFDNEPLMPALEALKQA